MGDAELQGAEQRSAKYRLVVHSIGTAGASAVKVLRSLRSGSDLELAALLYRAPSVLLEGLDWDKGERLRDALRQTGIEVELERTADGFQAGRGEWEISLGVKDPAHLLTIIEETALLVGVDFEKAKAMVLASPAVLMGRVSEATVTAVRARFEKLGCEVDASKTAQAVFDLVIDAGDQRTLHAIDLRLKELAVERSTLGPSQVMVTGLNSATTETLWAELARTSAKVRALNRELQRFDVRLERAPNNDEVRQWLTRAVGMPERITHKALSRMPFTLVENVRGERMATLLREAGALGAHATAVLLSLQSFSMEVAAGGDRTAARTWVQAIAGREVAEQMATGKPMRVAGPLTKLQARWLQHELRACGVTAQLEGR